jgi:hypothetical protein
MRLFQPQCTQIVRLVIDKVCTVEARDKIIFLS